MADPTPDDETGAAPAPATTPYAMMGGEEGVRALVDRFYDLMDLEPEFAHLRELHPTTLEGSRDKLFWFLSGWLGGPNLFIDRFGHPMLRARHLPYSIGVQARDEWLTCMGLAMAERVAEGQLDAQLQQRLLASFAQTANHMRNRAG